MSSLRLYGASLSTAETGSSELSTSLASVLDRDFEAFLAIDMVFDSGELNLWSGYGTQTINGKDYTGTGTLLGVSAVEETSEIAVRGAEITLSGISSSVISLALQEPYQGRVCTIYFGTTSQFDDMTEIFSGFMDKMDIQESGETCNIALAVENKLVDLERERVARYTSAYQKNLYPGDLGLDFIEDLQDKKITWGRASE